MHYHAMELDLMPRLKQALVADTLAERVRAHSVGESQQTKKGVERWLIPYGKRDTASRLKARLGADNLKCAVLWSVSKPKTVKTGF